MEPLKSLQTCKQNLSLVFNLIRFLVFLALSVNSNDSPREFKEPLRIQAYFS